jgi:hypothetical protein
MVVVAIVKCWHQDTGHVEVVKEIEIPGAPEIEEIQQGYLYIALYISQDHSTDHVYYVTKD